MIIAEFFPYAAKKFKLLDGFPNGLKGKIAVFGQLGKTFSGPVTVPAVGLPIQAQIPVP